MIDLPGFLRPIRDSLPEPIVVRSGRMCFVGNRHVLFRVADDYAPTFVDDPREREAFKNTLRESFNLTSDAEVEAAYSKVVFHGARNAFYEEHEIELPLDARPVIDRTHRHSFLNLDTNRIDAPQVLMLVDMKHKAPWLPVRSDHVSMVDKLYPRATWAVTMDESVRAYAYDGERLAAVVAPSGRELRFRPLDWRHPAAKAQVKATLKRGDTPVTFTLTTKGQQCDLTIPPTGVLVNDSSGTVIGRAVSFSCDASKAINQADAMASTFGKHSQIVDEATKLFETPAKAKGYMLSNFGSGNNVVTPEERYAKVETTAGVVGSSPADPVGIGDLCAFRHSDPKLRGVRYVCAKRSTQETDTWLLVQFGNNMRLPPWRTANEYDFKAGECVRTMRYADLARKAVESADGDPLPKRVAKERVVGPPSEEPKVGDVWRCNHANAFSKELEGNEFVVCDITKKGAMTYRLEPSSGWQRAAYMALADIAKDHWSRILRADEVQVGDVWEYIGELNDDPTCPKRLTVIKEREEIERRWFGWRMSHGATMTDSPDRLKLWRLVERNGVKLG
jgi:hypothetical protein